MTRIYAEMDGPRCTISAQGHATGSVEACAAISGILYALAGYVTNRIGHPITTQHSGRDGKRKQSGESELSGAPGSEGCGASADEERPVEVYTWMMESGKVLLDFNGDEGTTAAFEMAIIGLLQIAKAHPEQVCMEVR